jgi:hypothetical protein
MSLSAEVKIRTLAAGYSTLQAYFGTSTFRWFTNGRLEQGYYAQGTCLRMLRVSSVPLYEQRGLNSMRGIRFQLDVIDQDAETARAAAKAIIDWLGTISLAQNSQLGSPVTTPPQFPCFLLNQRHGIDPQLEPPAQVETLDVRVWNDEDF